MSRSDAGIPAGECAELPSTDEQLLQIVKRVSEQDFGLPFRHRCRFNPRLRTSGGRYILASHDIEINPRYVRLHGWSSLLGTVRHELCHYHLHLQGRGYRHRDRSFRDLLERVGGDRYAAPTGLRNAASVRYWYVCQSCGTTYPRRRRMDIRRFACGRCRGLLILRP